jgi:hypothetical protein
MRELNYRNRECVTKRQIERDLAGEAQEMLNELIGKLRSE